jgi:hypothetical protein
MGAAMKGLKVFCKGAVAAEFTDAKAVEVTGTKTAKLEGAKAAEFIGAKAAECKSAKAAELFLFFSFNVSRFCERRNKSNSCCFFNIKFHTHQVCSRD